VICELQNYPPPFVAAILCLISLVARASVKPQATFSPAELARSITGSRAQEVKIDEQLKAQVAAVRQASENFKAAQLAYAEKLKSIKNSIAELKNKKRGIGKDRKKLNRELSRTGQNIKRRYGALNRTGGKSSAEYTAVKAEVERYNQAVKQINEQKRNIAALKSAEQRIKLFDKAAARQSSHSDRSADKMADRLATVQDAVDGLRGDIGI
jgi:chromosome segregation ATPase